MPVAYQIRVYSPTGELRAVMDRFRSLQIEHRVNNFSTATITAYDLDPAVALFQLDSIIEVRRRYTEAQLDWYTEYVGFHRTPQHSISASDSRVFTTYSRGLIDLISRRTVRYYADTDGSAKGPGPADDMIKAYVRENAGALATVANRRVTDGVIPGFSVAPDLSQGPVWEGAHAWDTLLQTCQEIGEPNQVDFDVVWLGGAQFEFRTYYPQLGTNRAVPNPNAVIFSVEFGNTTELSHTVSRTEEITDVLILGPGEGPLRDTTHVPSAAITDSPFNLTEQNYNLQGEDKTQAILDAANEILYEKRALVNFTFNPIQTARTAYGKHYFLGDIVTARIGPLTSNLKIRAVTIQVSDVTEGISLELEQETDEFTRDNRIPRT